MAPDFDRFESFGHDNSLQNNVISGAQGLMMLMGSKVLIKMDRPRNTDLYS